MAFLFIRDWFDGPIAKAAGWTLVHSLWQGFALTVIAGIIILVTKRAKPELRYNLLSGLFFIFIAAACLTFIKELQVFTRSAELLKLPTDQPGTTIDPVLNYTRPVRFSLIDRFNLFINQYAPYLVALWFFIFVLKCLRLFFHINYVQRLRNYRNFGVPGWDARISELAALLDIRRAVVLRESMFAKVPVVIGFLKPVILLPAGLITNLPPQQIEAILLHELAHIRRNDYLVNLLQAIIETIFFFNPAVWWLSSQIRDERENCCDDMAISVIRNKTTFINALMAFQEYHSGMSLLAPAFPGKKYHLLHRIQRIVYNNNKNLNNMEKIFLGAGLLVTGFMTIAFSSAELKQEKADLIGKVNITRPVISHSGLDTIPEEKTTSSKSGTINNTTGGKDYKIVLKDDVITELYIDGKQIPNDKIGDYKETTDKIINETMEKTRQAKYRAEQSKFKAEFMKKQAGQYKEREKEYRKQAELMEKEIEERNEKREELIKEYKEQAEVMEKQMEEREEMKKELMKDYQEKLELFQKDEKEYSGKQAELMKKRATISKDQERMREKQFLLKEKDERELMKKQLMMAEKENYKLQDQYLIQKKQTNIFKRNAELAKERAEDHKREAELVQKDIIIDLLEGKVISSIKSLSFTLTNKELIVNGKKQPAALHKKFKDKYLGDGDGEIEINYRND